MVAVPSGAAQLVIVGSIVVVVVVTDVVVAVPVVRVVVVLDVLGSNCQMDARDAEARIVGGGKSYPV